MTVAISIVDDRVAATRKIVAEAGLSLPDPDVAALADDLFDLYGWLAANLHHRGAKTAAQKCAQLTDIRKLARKLAAELTPDMVSLLVSQARFPEPRTRGSFPSLSPAMVRFAIDRVPKLLGELAAGLLKTQLERVPQLPVDEWLIGNELPALYEKYFKPARAKRGDHGVGPKEKFVHACLEALGCPKKELHPETIAQHGKHWKRRLKKHREHWELKGEK